MNKAVFFDRDGVINQSIVKDNKPYPPSNLSEFKFNSRIDDLCKLLKQKKYLLFVFTNQPDVARGTQDKTVVESINKHIMTHLSMDKIYTCYHDNLDNCNCRKPKPGMILQAVSEYKIDLNQSFVIGDRWRDIDTGAGVGCKTIFIDYQYDEVLRAKPDYTVGSLKEILKLEFIF